MMIGDRGAQVLDWLTDWLGWLGAAAEELAREGLDWLNDLGVYGYGLGAGCALLVVLVLLWYGSRRA